MKVKHEETREYIVEFLQEIIALEAALKEALEGWEFWHGDIGPQQDRIAELRKLISE